MYNIVGVESYPVRGLHLAPSIYTEKSYCHLYVTIALFSMNFKYNIKMKVKCYN